MVDRPCCCPGRSLLGQFATDNFPPKFRSRTNFPKICVNGRRAEAVTGRAEAATGRAQAVTGDRKHFFTRLYRENSPSTIRIFLSSLFDRFLISARYCSLKWPKKCVAVAVFIARGREIDKHTWIDHTINFMLDITRLEPNI